MTPTPRRLLLLLAALFPGATTHAALDELQLRLGRELSVQLRWDNVGREPDYWQSGVPPEHHAASGLQTVTLRPGDETRVRLPAGEQLRLRDSDAFLGAEALTFFRSNGSGLDVALKAQHSDPDGSLLVSGDPDQPTLLRVHRPADAGTSIRVALFVSRRTPPDPLVRYRHLLAPQAAKVSVHSGFLTPSEPYWQLPAGSAVSLTNTGHRRLAVELRAVFPTTEAAREQHLEVSLTAAGKSVKRLVDTVADQAEPSWVNGKPAVLSRRERLYFDLSPDDPAPQLSSSYPLLVRVLGHTPNDYLLPAVNSPQGPGTSSPTPAQQSDPALALVLAEQMERRAWRDGGVREAGLAATAQLALRAEQFAEFSDVASTVRQFQLQTTFFRHLLPARKDAAGEAHLAYFIPPRLRALGETPMPLSGAEQHRAALQASIASGLFLPVGGPRADTPPAAPLQPRQIVLGGDVIFDTDRDSLRPEAAATLQAHVRELASAEGRIEVIGHTDSRASDAYNQDLSERRADSVTRFLASSGIAPDRLHAAGRGEKEPRADNGSEAGRQANRRVDIHFHSRPPQPVVTGYAADYELPERFAPSRIRVAVHAPEHRTGETLYLQFDDAPPQQLQASPPPALPEGAFTDTLGALALRIQGSRWPAAGGATDSGLFALAAPTAPQITAGVAELPLPASVRRVRLWRKNPDGPPLYAALQYRTSNPYTPAESTQPPAEQSAAAQATVARMLTAPETSPPGATTPAPDTGWQPLARLLDAARRNFVASLPPPPSQPLAVPADGGRQATAAAAAAADPLAALEGTAQDGTASASDRYWQQTELLLRLGEEHLALQRWHQLAWYAAAPQERAQARERLERHYRLQHDDNARVQLHAAALARGDTDAAIPLASALLDEDDADLARMVLLSLEPAHRPVELLLAAAYGSQWWQLFDETLAAHPDPLRRTYWQAYRAQAAGSDPGPLLARADAEGQALAEHGRRALRLQENSRGKTPAANLAAWSDWAFTHPGPRTWRDASTLAGDLSGAVTLYQIDRDRYLNAFTATADSPLRLRFSGPRRLRIDARPRHPASGDAPIDGWLRVRSADGLWLEPITDNVPADALEVQTTPAGRAGRAVRRELDFGPGWHEVTIDGERLPLLLRVTQEVPLRPLAHLPAPTPDTASLPAGTAPPEAGQRTLGWCADCSVIVARDQESANLWRTPALGTWQGRATLAATRLADTPVGQAPPLARLLHRGDNQALLALPPADAGTVRERAIALLWSAEKDPALREAALAQVLAAFHAFPATPDMASIVDRLSRGSGWLPLSAVSRSAGRRQVPVDGSQPESPSLRIRHALLPPLAPHERRISGEGQLLLSLDNRRPAQLTLSLANEELAIPHGAPLLARLQVDGAPPRTLSLSPGDPPRVEQLSIPAGRHSLRVSIAAPVANQFLRVGVEEAGLPVENSERTYHVATATTPVEIAIAGPAWLRVDELRERRTVSTYRYLAAPWQTVSQPVAAGQKEGLYRFFLRRVEPDRPVTPPRRVVVTPPSLPRPAATPDRPAASGAPRLVDALPLGGQEDGTWTLGTAWSSRPQLDDQPRPAIFRDEFMELSATHRYYAADPRRYHRTDLLARLRRNGTPTLGVRGEVAGPLGASPIGFSLSGSLFLQRPEAAASGAPLPNQLAAREAALPASDSRGIEGAAALAADLQQLRALGTQTWHIPRISAFANWQSLDENRRTDSSTANRFFDEYLTGTGFISRSDFLRRHALYAEDSLDHDVFSAYRADHPFGVQLGDTLYHQPWLDSLGYAGASVTSNADLRPWKPDHESLRAGWRQLLGPVRLHAEYQITHYETDRHRPDSATLDAVRFEILGETWRTRHQRSELGAALGYDLSRNTGAINLFWRIDFGNGRGFRDYRPGDVDFRELRERRQPVQDNNRIDGHEAH